MHRLSFPSSIQMHQVPATLLFGPLFQDPPTVLQRIGPSANCPSSYPPSRIDHKDGLPLRLRAAIASIPVGKAEERPKVEGDVEG